MVLAGGGHGFPGLNDVLVANSRAHQEYPIEHGNEAVGNRAQDENVEGPHTGFEEREMHLRRDIGKGQKRPGRQARNEKLAGTIPEAQHGNRKEQEQIAPATRLRNSA